VRQCQLGPGARVLGTPGERAAGQLAVSEQEDVVVPVAAAGGLVDRGQRGRRGDPIRVSARRPRAGQLGRHYAIVDEAAERRLAHRGAAAEVEADPRAGHRIAEERQVLERPGGGEHGEERRRGRQPPRAQRRAPAQARPRPDDEGQRRRRPQRVIEAAGENRRAERQDQPEQPPVAAAAEPAVRADQRREQHRVERQRVEEDAGEYVEPRVGHGKRDHRRPGGDPAAGGPAEPEEHQRRSQTESREQRRRQCLGRDPERRGGVRHQRQHGVEAGRLAVEQRQGGQRPLEQLAAVEELEQRPDDLEAHPGRPRQGARREPERGRDRV
jgi:hypothetical protein